MSRWDDRPHEGRSEELTAWAVCQIADALSYLADRIHSGLTELATSIELTATKQAPRGKER